MKHFNASSLTTSGNLAHCVEGADHPAHLGKSAQPADQRIADHIAAVPVDGHFVAMIAAEGDLQAAQATGFHVGVFESGEGLLGRAQIISMRFYLI